MVEPRRGDRSAGFFRPVGALSWVRPRSGASRPARLSSRRSPANLCRSSGPILEYDPPRRFVYKWGREPQSTVEIDLKEVEEGSLITARETGYHNDSEGWERCLDCASGWGEALTLLKFYLEHGLIY